MYGLLKLIREFIGGKTELGTVVIVGAIAVFVLPIAPNFTWEALMDLLVIAGAATGVALASRIEDKEGIIKAFQSLFGAWRKK